MADEQKKMEVVSHKEKFWRNIAIALAIIICVVILLVVSFQSKELSSFFEKQGGLIVFGGLSVGLVGAVLWFFLQKRVEEFDLEKAIREIRQKEYKLHGIIINPTNRLIEELTADSFLIEFEDTDFQDGNPTKRMVYSYNKKTKLYYPFDLGTKRDAKINLEKSEFHKRFLGQYEAEQKLKDLQDRMGVTLEKV